MDTVSNTAAPLETGMEIKLLASQVAAVIRRGTAGQPNVKSD